MSIFIKLRIAREERVLCICSLFRLSHNWLVLAFRSRVKATTACAAALLALAYNFPANAAATPLSNVGTSRGLSILNSPSCPSTEYEFTFPNVTAYNDAVHTEQNFTQVMTNAFAVLGGSAPKNTADCTVDFENNAATRNITFWLANTTSIGAARANNASRFAAARTPRQLYTPEQQEVIEYAIAFFAWLGSYYQTFAATFGDSPGVSDFINTLASALALFNTTSERTSQINRAVTSMQCLFVANSAILGGFGSTVAAFSANVAKLQMKFVQSMGRSGMQPSVAVTAALKFIGEFLASKNAEGRINAVLPPIPE